MVHQVYHDGYGVVIHNDYFRADDGGPYNRKGGEIFAQQVMNAKRMGAYEIETHAARGYAYNGYYTWPAFGYDQPLRAAAPEAMDVFNSPGGRDWWMVHGRSMKKAEFELEDGSRSLEAFKAYWNERRAKSKK